MIQLRKKDQTLFASLVVCVSPFHPRFLVSDPEEGNANAGRKRKRIPETNDSADETQEESSLSRKELIELLGAHGALVVANITPKVTHWILPQADHVEKEKEKEILELRLLADRYGTVLVFGVEWFLQAIKQNSLNPSFQQTSNPQQIREKYLGFKPRERVKVSYHVPASFPLPRAVSNLQSFLSLFSSFCSFSARLPIVDPYCPLKLAANSLIFVEREGNQKPESKDRKETKPENSPSTYRIWSISLRQEPKCQFSVIQLLETQNKPQSTSFIVWLRFGTIGSKGYMRIWSYDEIDHNNSLQQAKSHFSVLLKKYSDDHTEWESNNHNWMFCQQDQTDQPTPSCQNPARSDVEQTRLSTDSERIDSVSSLFRAALNYSHFSELLDSHFHLSINFLPSASSKEWLDGSRRKLGYYLLNKIFELHRHQDHQLMTENEEKENNQKTEGSDKRYMISLSKEKIRNLEREFTSLIGRTDNLNFYSSQNSDSDHRSSRSHHRSDKSPDNLSTIVVDLKKKLFLLESICELYWVENYVRHLQQKTNPSKTSPSLLSLRPSILVGGRREIKFLSAAHSDFSVISRYVCTPKDLSKRELFSIEAVFSLSQPSINPPTPPTSATPSTEKRRLLIFGCPFIHLTRYLRDGLSEPDPSTPLFVFPNLQRGVYLQDVALGSLENCFCTPRQKHAVLLLCDVLPSDVQCIHGFCQPDPSREQKMSDGVTHVPNGESLIIRKDASGATRYNQYLVHNPSKIQLRFLVVINL